MTLIITPRPIRCLSTARFAICLTLAALFAVLSIGTSLRADSVKDQLQDQHLVSIDRTIVDMQAERKDMRARRDAQIDELLKSLKDEDSRSSRDEGIASGAFMVLGVLHTLGMVKNAKKDAD